MKVFRRKKIIRRRQQNGKKDKLSNQRAGTEGIILIGKERNRWFIFSGGRRFLTI
jgi:hypothetical protein